MTRGYQLYTHVAGLVALGGMVLLWMFSSSAPQAKEGEARIGPRSQLYDEVADLLSKHYDGEVDYDKLYDGGLKGMAHSLDDKYTTVLTPVAAKASEEQNSGVYGGIGVNIYTQDYGFLVTAIFIGGPADKAAIKVGDKIVSADGVQLSTVAPLDRTQLIKGEIGTVVKLGVLRGEEKLDIEVTRGTVVSPSVRGVNLIEGTKIGYLYISSFSKVTHEQFVSAVKKLKEEGMESLILDLRFNPGGVLTSATKIADEFTDKPDLPLVIVGAVSEAKRKRIAEGGVPGAEESNKIYATEDEEASVDVPCVVLMNAESASASEILAGALQDYGLATIIGTRSYGKGVVQQKMRLQSDPRYWLKVTAAAYFTPLGNHLWRSQSGQPGGIVPDLPIGLSKKDQLKAERELQNLLSERQTRGDFVFEEAVKASVTQWIDPQMQAAIDTLQGKVVQLPLPPKKD